MYKLAVVAQNKNLSDLERVDMQIEFEELRKQLMLVPKSMLSQSRGGPPIASMPIMDLPIIDEFSGDGTNFLERMRNRIINGEEWNVREAWCPHGFSKEIYNDEGLFEAVEVVAGGKWVVVDDKNKNIKKWSQSNDGTIVTVNSGKELKTVREELELWAPVVLMDAESAADGAKLIKQHINNAQKWCDRIAEYSVLQSSGVTAGLSSIEVLYSAFTYLDKHPLIGYGLGGERPSNYLFADGVYDRVYGIAITDGDNFSFYFLKGIVKDNISRSISLETGHNAEKINNNAVAASPLYYRNNILTEVELAVTKTNQYEVQYV
jgi:hypothetical protein